MTSVAAGSHRDSVFRTPLEEEMRLKIDRDNDALYFRLTDAAVFESEEVQPGVILTLTKMAASSAWRCWR
jgi:hypothetical protein